MGVRIGCQTLLAACLGCDLWRGGCLSIHGLKLVCVLTLLNDIGRGMLREQLFIYICDIWHIAALASVWEEILGWVLSDDYIFLDSVLAVVLLHLAVACHLLTAYVLATDESLRDHCFLRRKGLLALISSRSSRVRFSTIVLPTISINKNILIIRQRTKLNYLLAGLMLLGVLLIWVEFFYAATDTFNQMAVGKCITPSQGIVMLCRWISLLVYGITSIAQIAFLLQVLEGFWTGVWLIDFLSLWGCKDRLRLVQNLPRSTLWRGEAWHELLSAWLLAWTVVSACSSQGHKRLSASLSRVLWAQDLKVLTLAGLRNLTVWESSIMIWVLWARACSCESLTRRHKLCEICHISSTSITVLES